MALLKLAKSVTAEELKNLKPIYQGLYVKQADGSYELDPDMHESLDTSGLNSALDKERKLNSESKKKLKVMEELGLTPEEFAEYAKLGKPGELKQKLEAAAAGKDGAVKDLERRLEDIRQGHSKELAKANQEKEAMQASLNKYLINHQVAAALQSAKGNIKLLSPHIVAQTTVFKTDRGDYEVRVVDANGEFRGDGKGGFMTVAGLIEEFKKDSDFKYAFEAEGKGGSGTKPGKKDATGGNGNDGATPGDLISQGLAQMTG
jgi:hypothetical protein